MIKLLAWISRLLARCSHRTLQRIGGGLGWAAAHLFPFRRRVAREALAAAFPEKTRAERRAILNGMYRHLATTAIECLAYTAPGAPDFAAHAEMRGHEHLKKALERNRGVLLLMGHIGNWECMGRMLSAHGFASSVIVRGFRNKAFEEYWRNARLRIGTEPLDRENVFRPCARRLRENRIVAMVLDQNARANRGVFVPFFGRPASTTPGLAQLSARTRAPVVPLYMIRQPDGRHLVTIMPPLEPPPDHEPETVRSATAAYTRILEDIIRAHPEQWTWGHHRWRTPAPPDAETAARPAARATGAAKAGA